MPVNENSYQNGKVYRIWSLETDKIYIGSSSDTLSNRFCNHKKNYKRWKQDKTLECCSSYILFDLVGVDNCKIELIKNFPCNSKAELNREEGKVMRENKEIIVNRKLAGRTMKEYYEHNKKEILEKVKDYYQEHKEVIAEKKKEYRQEHKEVIAEKGKEYRQEHKEVIAEKRKEYYQERKGELNKKHECECGGKYTHQHKSIHEKTQKHQNYLKSQ